MDCLNPRRWIFIFLIFNSFSDLSRAQRIFLPSSPDPCSPVATPASIRSSPTSANSENSLVLKTYPDGTKKIVPLEALNFRDEGSAFGGPPKLSIYQDTAKPPAELSPTSPERLTLASIGTATGSSTLTANLPPSAPPTRWARTAKAKSSPLTTMPLPWVWSGVSESGTSTKIPPPFFAGIFYAYIYNFYPASM